MSTKKISYDREKAFLSLLDDDNAVVRKALLKEFQQLNKSAIQFLRKIALGEDLLLAKHAQRFLKEVVGNDTVEAFRGFIQSRKHSLREGCIMLEKVLDASIDGSELDFFLNKAAARCSELITYPSSPLDRCRIINRVLFHEYGFRCNPEYQINPQNALITQTIRRRQGFAVSLSILYLFLAQKCNVKLNLINIPDYTILGCFQEVPTFYIDPQSRGSFRTADELYAILMSQNMDPHLSTLTPSSESEILGLCCQQLADQYSLDNKLDKANLFLGFMHSLEKVRNPQPQL